MNALEINKRIAGIKNYELHEGNNGLMARPKDSASNEAFNHPLSEQLPSLRNLFRCWNPAENIADAWELFEEMEESVKDNLVLSFHQKYLSQRHYYICGVQSVEDYFGGYKDPYIYIAGEKAETAPMAISLAYIKWRQRG